MKLFESINRGYNSTFQPDQLSIGVVIPIENYNVNSVPSMKQHLEMVQLVEKLDFKAIWVRDVPFHVPSFGDAGQTFDPFTYLGFLAGKTSEVALGIASVALPLHHPVHVAKSAATIDLLSNGRLILGVASGDRPIEYPAMNIDFDSRSDLFKDAFKYIRKVQESFPSIEDNRFGILKGNIDVLPKSQSNKIPLLITGSSRQTIEWNARHSDGWMYYPRELLQQAYTISEWRKEVKKYHNFDKPFMQPIYVILEENDDFKPQPIQLGFRIGSNYLNEYFDEIQKIGVNHVAINLRFNPSNIKATLEKLAEKVLPHFHLKAKQEIN